MIPISAATDVYQNNYTKDMIGNPQFASQPAEVTLSHESPLHITADKRAQWLQSSPGRKKPAVAPYSHKN